MNTTSDMLILVRNTIAADAALNAWCQANYTKNTSVYLGFDDDDPPKASDYPVVGIISSTRVRGADKHKDVWDVEISSLLENDGKQSISNGITYTGFLHAESMRDLVENALYRAKIANIETAGASAIFSNYPEFEAVSKVRISLIADSRSGISQRL